MNLIRREVEPIKITRKDYRLMRSLMSYYSRQYQDKDREMFLKHLINSSVGGSDRLRKDVKEMLERLSFDDIATIIYTQNYEVITTPEDKLLQRYENLANSQHITNRTRAKGIIDALDILDMKIEGINAVTKLEDLFDEDKDAPHCAI